MEIKKNNYSDQEPEETIYDNLLTIETSCSNLCHRDSVCWAFDIDVMKLADDDDSDTDSADDSDDDCKRIWGMTGVLIPSESEHLRGSQIRTCDDISGDLNAAILSIADPDEMIIDPDVLGEFELGCMADDLQFCYISNIWTASMDDMNLCLNIFPTIMKAVPGFKEGIALMLLASDKEKEYIPVFLENGWKVHCPDEGENCYSVYKGFSVFE